MLDIDIESWGQDFNQVKYLLEMDQNHQDLWELFDITQLEIQEKTLQDEKEIVNNLLFSIFHGFE